MQKGSPREAGQILIWIIVGALIVVIAGGAYYLGRSTSPKSSPTPTVISQIPQPTSTPSSTADETATWKTYRKDKLGFEFKYPEKYVEESSKKEFVTFNEETENSIAIRSKHQDSFTFHLITVNTNEDDFMNFNKLNNCDTDKHPGTYLGIAPCIREKPTLILIGNKKAKSLNIQVSDTYDALFIQTDEEPFIEISYGFGYAAPKEIFNQILSTFRFD